MNEFIIKSIKEFYEILNVPFSAKEIDSENIFSLQLYIIVNSKIPNLFTQVTLIDRLIPDELHASTGGYYLTTLIASLTYLIDGDK